LPFVLTGGDATAKGGRILGAVRAILFEEARSAKGNRVVFRKWKAANWR